jgi:membrane protein YqaA with SNARE-associated domain
MSDKTPRNLPKEKSRGVLLDFIIKHINKKYSLAWLWSAFLLEIFLIFPLDFVIIFYALQNKKKALFLSIGAAFCSTISAFVGYMIGSFCFNHFSWFIYKFISPVTFVKTAAWYKIYEKGIVFVATFLPLPFKAITISAGVCRLPLLTFLLMVFIARSLRFVLISLITIQLEDRIFEIIEKYSYLLLAGMGVFLLVVYVWLLT